ncbi:hypothetical protein EVG20_g7568 [Dentipellis fragilis]|uniref:Tyrosine specific protein phosphatases domain-containing protein n=1 Tax=Dentipellis fragilis TaxID=205917 RepID=A0A4Y9YEQ4_9AGAM|nr:hypothetical protein EVG20_g7568 [Dentipellis fragilis]
MAAPTTNNPAPGELDPIDPDHVAHVLSHPPFVSIPGVHNVRDLGAHPTSTPAESTRPGFMFRSGEISGITPDGKRGASARARDHDSLRPALRHRDDEVQHADPGAGRGPARRARARVREQRLQPAAIGPVRTRVTVSAGRLRPLTERGVGHLAHCRRFELYASGKTEAFMRLYSEILDAAGPSLETILRHVRDKPNEGFIFHCTAGKDRTGILAAILLMLAGVDDETIAQDYALTRIGREPMREAVMARLSREPIFVQNPDAALNMFSSRHETMLAFLQMFRERYGGAEGYLKQYCAFTDDDIATIRRNLVVRHSDPDPSTSANISSGTSTSTS